ncbi:MAG: hypothetical protein AUI63_01845 [Gemmatimonadetes bacterium 13_1_40CM_2_60_3]|nr:MAG: hypothetical protein AUI63_01845 [Gemmatimonadetes bacterium 13_1_40CM_2_60_3]
MDKKIGFSDSKSQAKANLKNLARAPEWIEVRLANGPSFGGSFASGLLKYVPPLARAQQTRRRISLGISRRLLENALRDFESEREGEWRDASDFSLEQGRVLDLELGKLRCIEPRTTTRAAAG